ncbi:MULTISPECIES: glycan-binding surface protein [Prevotellaceae]|jgi:hypothetical protein|uniref:Surface glycan-binding protein B xyloglucan binding domain-containing protein n=1 Tax=Xylanibacter rarus TaxID=1676614 RepID=A0A8E1USI3_9BACT|nr:MULTISPECIES: glycan-binding surface protein [Prevotellaceae]KOO69158.1 hypothetical protein ACU52_04630 [Xylanibacter rarus]CCX70528.1 uncharacterized protein BN567_01699 [Prevotella sp. CAG:255]
MKMFKNIWLLCLAFVTAGLVSCNDDDDAIDSAPISVLQVYLEDAEATVKDRPVEFARLGQTIRISGSGFRGMQKVYINGFDTYFNNAYVTDNNLILSIDTDTPVSDAPDSVRNTIRFVKRGTEYVYTFTIRAASPSITSIDNTLPMPGETVTVYGANLQETSKVTLPDGTEITGNAITNAPEDEDGEWFSFVMPHSIQGYGAITIECANGTAKSAEYFNNDKCMVLNFDGEGSQGFWSWSETGSMLGSEDVVDDPLNSGRGKVIDFVPSRLLSNGIAAGKSRATECWTAGNDDPMDDWSRMYSVIPDTTLLTDVAFQFDIYVPEAWVGTGHIQLCLMNNFNFGGIGSDDDADGKQTAFYCPWIQDGKAIPFKTAGWQTVTIPFSEFKKYASEIEEGKSPTFREVVEDRNAATYRNFGMGFVNTDFVFDGLSVTATIFKQHIYIDNWRVVPCKSEVISDFPDEEE